ncbi:MAG: hypothetical protein Kow00105_01960 [Phycisphaeraceae bacterium]
MPLIIDCYNVLHAEKPKPLAGLGEAALCVLLSRSRWVASGVTVVCDGSPKPESPDTEAVDPVELIYSGASRSADEVIIELIDKNTAPRRLTVVSNDRTIQRAARRRRARVWSAEEFLQRLARVGQTKGNRPPEKPGGTMPEGHVQRWLEIFGIEDDEADRKGKTDGTSRPDDADDYDADLEAFEREYGDDEPTG